MYILNYLLIYFLQISTTLPNFIQSCFDLSFPNLLIFFIHHLLDVFIFWAIFFLNTKTEYIIHIITCILVAIHWFSYGNRCYATVYMNRRCGYDEDYWLDSLKNRSGLRRFSEYFQFIWLGLIIFWEVYQLA